MKLVLKVKLIGRNKLEMTVCKVNKHAIKKYGSLDQKIHVNKNNNIVIWSCQDFIFDDRQIRLPDAMHIEDKLTHTHIFESDIVRKTILKNYLNALKSWSKDKNIFVNTYNTNVRFDGEFWIVD